MSTVYHMNAAHQQGDNVRAMADADAGLIDAADPPQLPAPRAQNSTATAAIRRLSVAFGGEHDQAAAAAGPPPAVDSRLGQRPGNERRSQRESENQQSTTAAHTSLSVQ